MNISAHPAIAHLRQHWQQRPANEQRALRLLALVIVLAAAAQTLWYLQAMRERLQRQLPVLAEQAAQARALAKQAEQGARLSSATLSAQSPKAPAAVGAVRQAAKTLGETLDIHSGDHFIRLQGDVDAGHWLRWLATLETEQHWQLVRLTAKRSAANTLSIDAELRPANHTP